MKPLKPAFFDERIAELTAGIHQIDRLAQRLSFNFLSLDAKASPTLRNDVVAELAAANNAIASQRAELAIYEQARKEAVRLEAGITWELGA